MSAASSTVRTLCRRLGVLVQGVRSSPKQARYEDLPRSPVPVLKSLGPVEFTESSLCAFHIEKPPVFLARNVHTAGKQCRGLVSQIYSIRTTQEKFSMFSSL